jgi:hypothetical protein
MSASNWTQADEQFFDAMRFYTDAGEQHKAVMCLKYVHVDTFKILFCIPNRLLQWLAAGIRFWRIW